MKPIDIQVNATGTALELRWADGLTAVLSARMLRANCRSAPAQRLRLEGRQPEPAADTVITRLEPIGHYAINLAFSDGHARGIYPWSYLRELALLGASEGHIDLSTPRGSLDTRSKAAG
jgi:DUF971 family protein